MRLNDDDLRALEELIRSDPRGGDVIPGTGGLRKIRFAPPSLHSGKRGATRVCYAVMIDEYVYLFTIYAKNEQADIKKDDKKFFKDVLDQLKLFHS
jgi:hypothetical protein